MYNEILLCNNKGMRSYHLNNMDGSRGCYAKWNESESNGERQMQSDFMYMCNLQNKISKQTRS